MITFQVNDMTCAHCASTITRSVQAQDPGARVTIDISQHRVMIEPAAADGAAIRQAIADAGYSPALVEPAMAPASARGGSCCGRCN